MPFFNGKNNKSSTQNEKMKTVPQKYLGPVVKNFVSLTLSLSPQFVNHIYRLQKQNTLLFFVEKDSHIFSTKNNSEFVKLPFEILTKRLYTISTLLILNNLPLTKTGLSTVSSHLKGY